MKLNTNFASPSGRMLPYLIWGAILLSVTAIVVSIVLYISTRQLSHEIPELEARLAKYQSREIQKSAELLPDEKLLELRSRIKSVNELSSVSGLTLPQIFTEFESLMPDGVWLLSLQYRSHENEVKLVAESFYGDNLTEFMGKLERSGNFSQVLLTRQTQHVEGAKNTIQFEIQLKGSL